MKVIRYTFITVGLLVFIASCGMLKNGHSDALYNKHNREKVKIKKGLFSAPRALFGSFTTTAVDKGVTKRVIPFKTRQEPFHFSLNEQEVAKVSVQAAYTDKESLADKDLPASFSSAAISNIFYAWISGSTANNLDNWELIVKNPSYEELSSNAEIGILRSSNAEISVHASNRPGGSGGYDALCFEFQLKGIAVAAVQTKGKRQYVWMQQGLNEEVKYAIAGAAAALLLR